MGHESPREKTAGTGQEHDTTRHIANKEGIGFKVKETFVEKNKFKKRWFYKD